MKSERDEQQELEDVFNPDKMNDLVKKAKRKSIKRSLAVSSGVTIATLVLLFGAYIGKENILGSQAWRTFDDSQLYNQITDPNEVIGNMTWTQGFLNGMVTYGTFRFIEGVPVSTGEKRVAFSMFGTSGMPTGNYSPLTKPTPYFEENFGSRHYYNAQTGVRELIFYHPGVKTYEGYLNEFPRLDKIGQGRAVEMALSFDRDYSFDEVNKMMPEGVHAVWYWVDTYNRELMNNENNRDEGMSAGPVMGSRLIGFSSYDRMVVNSKKQTTPADFIGYLEQGIERADYHQGEFQDLYDFLRGQKAKPEPSDVRIVGVVVTGTPNDVKQLQSRSFVKAAVLGADVELES